MVVVIPHDNAAQIITITVPHLVHLVARQNFSPVTLHRYSATFREVTVHLLSALFAMFKSRFLVLLQDTAADNCCLKAFQNLSDYTPSSPSSEKVPISSTQFCQVGIQLLFQGRNDCGGQVS